MYNLPPRKLSEGLQYSLSYIIYALKFCIILLHVRLHMHVVFPVFKALYLKIIMISIITLRKVKH